MGQMIVRKLDDEVIERIKKKAKLEGTSAEQVARDTLTDAFKPNRDELIARMEAIRATSKPASGQDIIDEIRRDRDNNLGRPILGLKMIIDASVASHWFAETEFSKAADPFRSSSSLIAPGFLLVETANVLFKQSRAGRIAAARCSESVEVLRESMAELVPDVHLLSQAIDLAVTNNHPVYDCLYLALALERHVQLVTADRQLARRAEALGIAVDLITAA